METLYYEINHLPNETLAEYRERVKQERLEKHRKEEEDRKARLEKALNTDWTDVTDEYCRNYQKIHKVSYWD